MNNKSNESTDETRDLIDRRSFVKFIPAVGGAGLLAANLPLGALAQTPTPLPSPSPSPTPATPSPLAEAYAEVVKQRFGAHVEGGQWAQIKRELEGNVRSSDRLRTFKLQNGDEPDFTFTA
ncbi:MAG: twin-arginine translocation signal domain-containing protein [Acidobacteriota bacterium]|nr:twin-arginine translocation signal domain-containing protein [Acidobacteriota bacterium]